MSTTNNESAVTENIKKARRMLYSFLAAGLHEENGHDPETSLHLYQTYVQPILLHGMAVVFPRQKFWKS